MSLSPAKKLQAPKHEVGDRVLVRNYRTRPPRLEWGTVLAVRLESRYKPGDFHLSYEVQIARPNRNYRVHVDDASVEAR